MASAYHLYGYESNLGFSFNFMCILTLSFYGLAIVTLILSAVSTKYSRMFKKVTFVIANDLCYALVVFSTPNLLTALFL